MMYDEGSVSGNVNPYAVAIDGMKRLLEIPRYIPPAQPRPHWPDFVNDYFDPSGNLYSQYSQPHQWGGMIRSARDDLNAAQIPNYTPMLEQTAKDVMNRFVPGANALMKPKQLPPGQPTVAGQTWAMLKHLLGQ